MKLSLSRIRIFIFACLMLCCPVWVNSAETIGVVAFGALPTEAQQTLTQIKRGGPYPFPKDGAVFGNYQHVLPPRARGYYHEFTVKTPSVRNRGAQRIVVGGGASRAPEYFYTGDHYATFKRIQE